MLEFFLFVVSTVGLAHIIVDGSIMKWFRDGMKGLAKTLGWPALGDVVDCYLCCGTWCGFLMGLLWISYNPLKVLACGFAGGILANFVAVYLNYLEAQTIVSIDHKDPTEGP